MFLAPLFPFVQAAAGSHGRALGKLRRSRSGTTYVKVRYKPSVQCPGFLYSFVLPDLGRLIGVAGSGRAAAHMMHRPCGCIGGESLLRPHAPRDGAEAACERMLMSKACSTIPMVGRLIVIFMSIFILHLRANSEAILNL